MRILVIEDNRDISANIASYLEKRGVNVTAALDGLSGLHLACTEAFDLIVLDVMLPGIDGFQLCQRLRNDGNSAVPILMLTARDALADRIHGLSLGADDYLVKPFALAELCARIEAVVRRSRGVEKRLLAVADLSLDLDLLQARRAGQLLKLNPLALKLLEILMRRSPHLVRREQLELELWHGDCPDAGSLRGQIHALRQIVDKPFEQPLIHTVHGLGYRMGAAEQTESA